ncbi:flagellar protein FlaG [Desulfurivibrio sp. D14AmB]|uniref:flagellar protein FlaG n=1 Tax=Desulfurivibrio sp. D14AmB TaxID=3374370 RepID=UPI00376EE33F
MDVNLHNEVKSHVLPAATAVEREEKNRPPVTPVADSGSAARSKADDRSRFDQKAAEQQRKVSPDEAEEIAKEMQSRLDSIGNTRLLFALHRDPEAVVVQITDRQSGDVIRQFPAEESLALRQKLNELVGMLFDGKA